LRLFLSHYYKTKLIAATSYTNAHGTHKQLKKVVDEGIAFAWHGGDISYADDW
jgi:hypothetical protein